VSGSAADGVRQHRNLRRALRLHRAHAQRTQQDVARAMEWSLSKVVRIENGDVRISVSDLAGLLRLYGIEDSGETERLLAWARASRNQPWREYRDVLTASFIRFLAYEAAASRIWHVQPHFVPGILQVERYARAFMTLSAVTPSSSTATDRRIEVRMQRQDILRAADPPAIVVFLDESVIRRVVGSPAIMREQLEHLLEVAATAKVSLRIMAFDAGIYPGIKEAFVRLAFDDPADPEVLYIENGGDVVTRDEPGSGDPRRSVDLGDYQKAIEHLDAVALSESASKALIRTAVAALPQD
jgi:transcriptional regulator with XRE-family HTH domain